MLLHDTLSTTFSNSSLSHPSFCIKICVYSMLHQVHELHHNHFTHTHTQTHICAPIYTFFWRSPYSPFCKIDILTQKLYPPISTQVFNCFGRQFCLHFEAFLLGTAPVYMAFLRFMGEDKDARKFSYTLEVGAFGRKLIWQGVPRSIRDSHARVRDSQDGLIIPRSMALYFSAGTNQELKLRITGRIWKV